MRNFRTFLTTLAVMGLSMSAKAQTVYVNSQAYLQVLVCHDSAVINVMQNNPAIVCVDALSITQNSKMGANVSIRNNEIVYVHAGVTGRDTLEYTVQCVDTTYITTLCITVVKCPDNIVETDCFDIQPAVEWSMA